MRLIDIGRALAALLLSACAGAGPLQLPADLDLAQIQQDGRQPHEHPPLGVPRGYDWARGPRVGAGNTPGAFRAATGWGQAFAAEGAAGSVALQVRAMQVLLCAGPEHAWQLVQRGAVEGRQFRADFAGNAATQAPHFERDAEFATIGFDAGTAFHFWPAQGRFDLPAAPLCGVLVLLQARLDPAAPAGAQALIGLGADYWSDRRALWDRYRTNRDIAIGRLRSVTPEWRWYGLSTASDADLERLRTQGYELAADLCRNTPCR